MTTIRSGSFSVGEKKEIKYIVHLKSLNLKQPSDAEKWFVSTLWDCLFNLWTTINLWSIIKFTWNHSNTFLFLTKQFEYFSSNFIFFFYVEKFPFPLILYEIYIYYQVCNQSVLITSNETEPNNFIKIKFAINVQQKSYIDFSSTSKNWIIIDSWNKMNKASKPN